MSDDYIDSYTVGPLMHERSEDGLQLVIEEARPDGVHRMTLTWPTRAEADENWEGALADYAAKKLGGAVREPGQTHTARHIGLGWWFHIIGGPPTWWCPRVRVTRHTVMVGWFQRGYALGRPRKETT